MSRTGERVFGIWEVPPLIADLISNLSGRSRALLGLPASAASGDLAVLAELILSRRGEVSGALLAESMVKAYAAAPLERRQDFLRSLLSEFGVDTAALDKAMDAYRAAPDAVAAGALHVASEPRRQELFRRINFAPGGTATLVRMREVLLDMLRAEPELKPVDDDFCHLFSSWFNRGFLRLRQIDWKTPANILESLIRYEAVHEIQGWDDLRRRLQPEDRRCYGFFHPQLEDDPLIFVEVALTDHIPTSIQDLLAEDRHISAAEKATTAVFYSISNCQRGLNGVSLGNFLIKHVVAELKRELPRLETFVTLSPIPGFAAWLAREEEGETGEAKAIARAIVAAPGWQEDPAALARAEHMLPPLAAHYLLAARRGDGRPLDPVARFHLGNGAMVEQLDFLGDRSMRGMRQSHGMMVNYLYRPNDIEKNHEAYAETGRVAAQPSMRKMAQNIRLEEYRE